MGFVLTEAAIEESDNSDTMLKKGLKKNDEESLKNFLSFEWLKKKNLIQITEEYQAYRYLYTSLILELMIIVSYKLLPMHVSC